MGSRAGTFPGKQKHPRIRGRGTVAGRCESTGSHAPRSRFHVGWESEEAGMWRGESDPRPGVGPTVDVAGRAGVPGSQGPGRGGRVEVPACFLPLAVVAFKESS